MALAVQRSFDDLGTPLSQVTFVVLDVETTGGSPAACSLTEVAAARYRGGELLGTYQTFVRPDVRIPPFITALTGISDAMVADAPTVGEMLPSFLEFLGGGVVVGHNVRFDLSFLNHALTATGRDRLANATVDTLALARRLVRDMVPNCRLGTLAATLHLPHQPSHRALTDVLATGDLLHALLERAGSFGIVGLEELLDLPRLVGHPQAAKLRLTNRLPRRSGVYWFTDAAGHVLYVGKATDLHSRVRSYFSGDTRNKVGRLLRQMDAVHHRVCPGPLTAAVLEGRLIRAWAPPFNQQGRVRRRDPGAARRAVAPRSGGSGPGIPAGSAGPVAEAPRPRRTGRAQAGGPPRSSTAIPSSCWHPSPSRCRTSPARSATRTRHGRGTRPNDSGCCSAGTAGWSRYGGPVGWSCRWTTRGRSSSTADCWSRRHPCSTAPISTYRAVGSTRRSASVSTGTTRSGSSWPNGSGPMPNGCASWRWRARTGWPCGPIGSRSSPSSARRSAGPRSQRTRAAGIRVAGTRATPIRPASSRSPEAWDGQGSGYAGDVRSLNRAPAGSAAVASRP